MAEKVLIAVDSSEAARKAVEYVARIFGKDRSGDVDITLFHAAEALREELYPQVADGGVQEVVNKALRQWSEQAAARAEKLLDGHKQLLVKSGIAAERVHTKHTVQKGWTESRRVVAAQAIIDEARSGGYTTVVVGRRGTSNVPELFIGGVAAKVSEYVTDATVWIVD